MCCRTTHNDGGGEGTFCSCRRQLGCARENNGIGVYCTNHVVHAGGASSRVHGSLVRLKHVCIIGNHYITVMSDSKIKIYKVYNIIGRATRHYLAAVPCAHGRSTGFHQRPPVGRAYCQTRVKQ